MLRWSRIRVVPSSCFPFQKVAGFELTKHSAFILQLPSKASFPVALQQDSLPVRLAGQSAKGRRAGHQFLLADSCA
jgi:hypothetical protein